MTLLYRFKKDMLNNGKIVMRPKIFVTISGKIQLDNIALIDTGCDVTIIPLGIARIIGLELDGDKELIYTYNEKVDVRKSYANFTFRGKKDRKSITIERIPVLIDMTDEQGHEEEVVLGVEGIFDSFDIKFEKGKNKITFKRSLSHTKLKN